jgi:Glycine-rich domain
MARLPEAARGAGLGDFRRKEMKPLRLTALIVVVLMVCSLAAQNTNSSAQTNGPNKKTSTAGLTGVAEFFTSGTFTVPSGVSTVLVQIWGGGGSGSAPNQCVGVAFGANGGGGAFTETVVAVSPGTTYTVTVGEGGAAADVGENGTNGGDSEFALGPTVLAFAGGGQGGQGATDGGGGATDSSAQISHSGHAALPNAALPPLCTSSTCTLLGGAPYASNLIADEYVPDGGGTASQLGFGAQEGFCATPYGIPIFFPGPAAKPGYVRLTY